MRKQLTGEPVAGEPHTGFGGRGERQLFPTPIIGTVHNHLASWRMVSLHKLPMDPRLRGDDDLKPAGFMTAIRCARKKSSHLPDTSSSRPVPINVASDVNI